MNLLRRLEKNKISRGDRIEAAEFNPEYKSLKGKCWYALGIRYQTSEGERCKVLHVAEDPQPENPGHGLPILWDKDTLGTMILTPEKAEKHSDRGSYLGYYKKV